jgi:hypothetical protein
MGFRKMLTAIFKWLSELDASAHSDRRGHCLRRLSSRQSRQTGPHSGERAAHRKVELLVAAELKFE